MTPEIEKKRRELFEGIMSQKYSAAIGWHERDENGYLMATIRDQWTGFNAALDSVEIDLSALNDLRHHGEFRRGLTHSASQIEATGLGLKVK